MLGRGEQVPVHRLQALIDGRLKLIEFLALFPAQAEIAALADQFTAPPVLLPPGLLCRNRTQDAAKEVPCDLLRREVSRGSFTSQLGGQRLIERNGEVHGDTPCGPA